MAAMPVVWASRIDLVETQVHQLTTALPGVMILVIMVSVGTQEHLCHDLQQDLHHRWDQPQTEGHHLINAFLEVLTVVVV